MITCTTDITALPCEIITDILNRLDFQNQMNVKRVCKLWDQILSRIVSKTLITTTFQNQSFGILGRKIAILWPISPKLAKRILRTFILKIKPLPTSSKLEYLHLLLKPFGLEESKFKSFQPSIIKYLYNCQYSSNDIRLALNNYSFEPVKTLPLIIGKMVQDDQILSKEVHPTLIEKIVINPAQTFEINELVAVEDRGTYIKKTSIWYGKVMSINNDDSYQIRVALKKEISRPSAMIGKIPS